MDPGRVEVGFDPLTDPTGLTLQNRSVLEIGSRVRSQSANRFGIDFLNLGTGSDRQISGNPKC